VVKHGNFGLAFIEKFTINKDFHIELWQAMAKGGLKQM
jgi:hypothetical protein